MSVFEIKIPQLGEGLQEARLVRFLKQPGDPIVQDEPIYEMETDKAVMEIESPTAGVLEVWEAHEDDVLPIGAVIGRIAINGAVVSDRAAVEGVGTERTAASEQSSNGQLPEAKPEAAMPADALRNAAIPPRTRAYAREKGLSDADLLRLAQEAGGKLMPEAIDRYLSTAVTASPTPEPAASREVAGSSAYEDIPLPQKQRTLVYRLQRGTQATVPATMEMPIAWGTVEAVRAHLVEHLGEHAHRKPSQFLLFAWCVAQAAKNHPRVRSALLNDSTVRQYAHLHLGIAVARPDDELLMARVSNADALEFTEFVETAQEAIKRARDGEDQTGEAMQLTLTSMAGTGVRIGIPVFVAPAMGSLFIGTPYDEAYPLHGGGVGFRRMANMVLSFDHRLANGIGASNFLAEIRARVEGLPTEFAAHFS